MGFAGNLNTIGLPEVLQTLNRIKATGVLRLASSEGGRDVVFDQGELLGITFRRGEERQALLRRLILDGCLDAESAAQISHAGRESQVVARLIEGGVLDQAAVKEAAQRQAEEELQSLFTWDYADFVFHDAGPDAEEITAQVARVRGDGLVFNLNSMLMESARRQDEWERVRRTIPDGSLVLGPREGMEVQIAEASKIYPASAVLPLVDAVRSVDDLVKDSVATRLDTWTVLAGLIEQGLVVPLTRDDIIYHGDFLASQNDLLRASTLYRRALAARPTDQETARKLADLLTKLGDAPEAAACYSQLAIGCLNANDAAMAVGHARKAVQLAPQDPALRQALVRCLLAQDPGRNTAEAVGELLQLVEIYTSQDRLEDARSTCLKVIELDKTNEPARRQLARIFSAAARDDQAEDVVVCIQCGETNHREATDCQKCKASLQLTCLACGRVVGVSDRMCIFCGEDPHRGSLGRRAGGNPATSRIVNPDKVKSGAAPGGKQALLDQLDAQVAAARAKEAIEDWDGALAAWREVSKIQVDSPELIAHIRSLETIIHDRFVEDQIEKGHQYRRIRRFWAAIKCYKAALRTMPSDDPRTQRLVEILAATQKVGQRIALVYAAAILIILVGAFLALQPMFKQHRMQGEVEALMARLEPLAETLDGNEIAALRPEVEAMEQRVRDLGDGDRWREVRTRMAEASGTLAIAWQRAGAKELEGVDLAIEQGDLKKARDRMMVHSTLWQDRSPRVKQIELKLADEQKRRDELNARIQDAPRVLASVQAAEAAGKLGDAIAGYRSLAESPNAEVSAKAKESIVRLAPTAEAVSKAVEQALADAQRLMQTDLLKADAALVEVADRAVVWSIAERLQLKRGEIAKDLAEAKSLAAGLGPSATLEQLAAFLARYPGAPEASSVRNRHDAIVRARVARAQALDRYADLMKEQRWEQAWTAGRDLLSGYGAGAGDVRLPLVVETTPAGATVKIDGRPAGTTPVVVTYVPGQKSEITVEAPSCQPLTRRLDDLSSSWRYTPVLARAMLWRAELGKPVASIVGLGAGGISVVTSDGIAVLSDRGQVRWRVALGGDDMGGNRNRQHEQISILLDGRTGLGLPGGGVVILDAKGAAQRLATNAEVRGRLLGYVNDVLGASSRAAFAAEAIFSGEPGGAFSRIPIPAEAISGPVAITKDIDRVLIVADVRGHLVGVEESTRKVLWDQSIQAADIGQLVPISDDAVVTLLDGARIACFSLTPEGATLRWTHQLESPALGELSVSAGAVHVASGAAIVRITTEGTVLPALALPAVASAPVAANGKLVVAGCSDGSLHVFRDGSLLWSTPLGAAPTAVGINAESVYVAAGSGALVAFAP